MRQKLSEEERKRQEKKLRCFDEAVLKNTDITNNGKLVFWIFGFIEMLLFLFPVGHSWKEIKEDGITILYMMIWPCGSISFYMQSYFIIMEGKKNHSLWKKCRYLPVERSVFIRTRMEYLWNITWKVTLVAIVLQVLGALLETGRFSLFAIAYALVFAGVIPFLVNAANIYLRTREKERR